MASHTMQLDRMCAVSVEQWDVDDCLDVLALTSDRTRVETETFFVPTVSWASLCSLGHSNRACVLLRTASLPEMGEPTASARVLALCVHTQLLVR